eukprot:10326980-Heterocapsa_arctica.AAC.1
MTSREPRACGEEDFLRVDRVLGPLGHSSSAYMIKAVRVASLPILFQLPSPLDAWHVTHRCTIARASMGKLVVLEPFVLLDAAA